MLIQGHSDGERLPPERKSFDVTCGDRPIDQLIEVARFENLPLGLRPDQFVAAIGDIHGMKGALDILLSEALDREVTDLVTLGDMIDRGPRSLAVLERLRRFSDETPTVTCTHCMGNHEHMLLNALRNSDEDARNVAFELWYFNGGKAVIDEAMAKTNVTSITMRDVITMPQLEFIERLLSHHVIGRVLFVHAGVSPQFLRTPADVEVATTFATMLNLRFLQEDFHPLWIRKPFLEHSAPAFHAKGGGHGGFFVIHGHTPSSRVSVNRDIARARINLDGGSSRSGWVRMALLSNDAIRVVEAKSAADHTD